MNPPGPVLKICFGPPTAESKNLKNHVNFGVGDLFFRSPALWSSQNVFGPPTAGRVVVDFKDRGWRSLRHASHIIENLFLTSAPFMRTLSHCHEHEKLDMPKRARVPG